MLGFCGMVLRLLGGVPAWRPGTRDEARAIAELYFGWRQPDRIDPGLVERLLWWEGIDGAELERAHGDLHRMRSTLRVAETAHTA